MIDFSCFLPFLQQNMLYFVSIPVMCVKCSFPLSFFFHCHSYLFVSDCCCCVFFLILRFSFNKEVYLFGLRVTCDERNGIGAGKNLFSFGIWNLNGKLFFNSHEHFNMIQTIKT